MADPTCTIAARSVPVALRDAADLRRKQLNGLPMSRYIEHLVAADCARAGLWLPDLEPVQSTDTPTSRRGEKSE